MRAGLLIIAGFGALKGTDTDIQVDIKASFCSILSARRMKHVIYRGRLLLQGLHVACCLIPHYMYIYSHLTCTCTVVVSGDFNASN